VIYLDTSAILKLLRHEPESGALKAHLKAHPERDLITSALATVEVARALVALGAPDIADLPRDRSDTIAPRHVTMAAVAVTAPVLDLARSLRPAVLRSLDAVHVATAKLVVAALDHVITYDKRMLAAASAAGLRTASPS